MTVCCQCGNFTIDIVYVLMSYLGPIDCVLYSVAYVVQYLSHVVVTNCVAYFNSVYRWFVHTYT